MKKKKNISLQSVIIIVAIAFSAYFFVHSSGRIQNTINESDFQSGQQLPAQTSSTTPAPSNVTATPLSNTSIRVAWTAPSSITNVQGYTVHFSSDPNWANSTSTYVAGSSTLSYDVTGLIAGTTFTFEVKAEGTTDQYDSPFSPIVTTQTSSSVGAPQNVTVTALSNTKVRVSWQVPSGNSSLQGYTVRYSSDPDWANTIYKFKPGNGSSSYEVSGLIAGTTYSFQVKGEGAGLSDQNDTPFSTSATLQTTSTVQTPSNVTATSLSSTSVKVSWSVPSGSGNLQGYTVRYSSNANWANTTYKFKAGSGTTSYNVTGLTAGVTYYFQVKGEGTGSTDQYDTPFSVTATLAGTGGGTTGPDTTPPTTSTTGPSGWSNTIIQRTLTCDDTGGCATINWKFILSSTTGCSSGTYTTVAVSGSHATTMASTSTTTPEGQYRLCYYSLDSAGNSETPQSKEVFKIDTTAPTGSITAPLAGATIAGTTTLSASASDTASGVASVTFKVDGTTVGTDTTSPYTFAWNSSTVANGSHTVLAVATDVAGNTTPTSSVTITVNNVAGADTTNPTVTISAPTNNTIVAFTSILVDGIANDNVGVTSVTMKVNGVATTVSQAQGSNNWNNWTATATLTPNFANIIEVKAYDAAGNVGSRTITVTHSPGIVTNGTPISPILFGLNAWMPKQIGAHPYGGKLETYLCGSSWYASYANWIAGSSQGSQPACVLSQIKQSGAKSMRYGGVGVDTYYDGSMNSLNSSKGQYLAMVENMQANGITPILQVPYNGGQYTPAQAADLVNYINVVKNKGVKYWTIGNEPDLWYGANGSAQNISTYFKQFAEAMKNADPSISITGPDLASFDSGIMNALLGGANDITGSFTLTCSGCTGTRYYLDVANFHRYPFSGGQTRAQVIASPTSDFLPSLLALKAKVASSNALHGRTGANALKTAVTEINVDYQNPGNGDPNGVGATSFLGGQYWANILNYAMREGVDFVNFWSVVEGMNIGYITDSGTLTPAYYHFQMLAKNFHGNYATGTSKVNGATDSEVTAFGATDTGMIAVMILNQKSTTSLPYTVRLNTAAISSSNTSALKINIDAGVAIEYTSPASEPIAPQSTVMLLFNGSGTLVSKTVYKVNDSAPTTSAPSNDTTNPTVTITAPTNNTTVSATSIPVSGTANDNVGVTSVTMSVNGTATAVSQAPDWNNWTATATLTPSSINTIVVKAYDAAGNMASSTITVTHSPGTTLAITSGPTTGSTTTSGATISWATNVASTSQVKYATSTALLTSSPTLTTLNSSAVTSHIVTLSGLTANTTYYYQVVSTTGTTVTSTPASFTTTATSGGGTDPIIYAAGDIANGCCGDGLTANWMLAHMTGVQAILTLGDNAYNAGTFGNTSSACNGGSFPCGEFWTKFNPSWGNAALIALMRPSPGNHEYGTSNAQGYWDYFHTNKGLNIGAQNQYWYSYNVGNWHIVSLNSSNECSPVSCASNSAQAQWLQADLQANQTACSIAYWHHPRFSSSPTHGSSTAVQPLWDVFQSNGGDIMLNGHVHNYERFAPQNGDGTANANGVREFVVGTGGTNNWYSTGSGIANSLVRIGNTYGVLKLTLHANSYDWEFVNTSNQTLDSGTGACH
ncbi:MAG: hypothetical protein RL641_24 [Candidatus Parcubacteria bacterium]|jgi:hypothetical protein